MQFDGVDSKECQCASCGQLSSSIYLYTIEITVVCRAVIGVVYIIMRLNQDSTCSWIEGHSIAGRVQAFV